MCETRRRPAREAERFRVVVRANLWFWGRMRNADDQVWEAVQEWNAMPDSLKIRRHNAAMPAEAAEDGNAAEMP